MLDKEYVPVEDPSLPLDPCGHDKDTDDTKGEEGEDDPEGSVSGMGRVDEFSLGHGLIISAITRSGMPDDQSTEIKLTQGPWGKGRWCSGPPW